MSWIAVAVGVGSAVTGGVQANQERQRKKGVIGKAYDVAGQRLALRQGDVRQSLGESLTARGVAPRSRPGAPRDIGSQAMADLGVEQGLESRDLAERKGAEYSAVNAEANSAMIASAVNGISAGVNLHGAMAPGRTPGGAAPGAGVMVDTPPPGATKYPGAFAGIDPVDPLGRGAWKSPGTVGGFNKYSEGV